MYQYKRAQVPPNIEVQAKQHRGNEAAAHLEGIVNANGRDDWEFYRVDEIGVSVKPAALLVRWGKKTPLALTTLFRFANRHNGCTIDFSSADIPTGCPLQDAPVVPFRTHLL